MFEGKAEIVSDALWHALAPEHPPLLVETATIILPLGQKPRDLHGTIHELLLKRLGLGKKGWEIKSVSPPDGDIAYARLHYRRLASAAMREREPEPPQSTPEEESPLALSA